LRHRKRKDLVKNGVIDKEGNVVPSFQLSKSKYTPDYIKREEDYKMMKISTQNSEL
jgi:hypothetical protein